MSDETDFATTDAMIRDGGSFVQGLGQLFRAADPMNQTRLKIAFSDYFATYRALAQHWAKDRDPAVPGRTEK